MEFCKIDPWLLLAVALVAPVKSLWHDLWTIGYLISPIL
jgi:hypothetical protein